MAGGGGDTSCNKKYFKSSGIGAMVWTQTGLFTSWQYCFVESPKTHHVAKNETKGAIITSSCRRQTKDWGRSQGRPVLDQQGPFSRRSTRANLVVH